MKRKIIAIDGPAGSGKSTVAQKIAGYLGIVHFDSGSIYRLFTHYILREKEKIEPDEDYLEMVDRCAGGIRLDFSATSRLVYLFGENVTEKLRMEIISKNVNKIANNGRYREKANLVIKFYARSHDMVIDGRDVGTVLFPETPFKFYLDAACDERAKRRYNELLIRAKNSENFIARDISFEEIKEDILKRDNLDKNREVAPLVIARDAIYVDSTNMGITQVVECFMNEINKIEKINKAGPPH